MTSPLKDWQVVLSKYAACLAFYVLLWVPTLVYLPILLKLHMGRAVFEPVWTVYSLLLLGGLGGIILGLFSLLLPFDTRSRRAPATPPVFSKHAWGQLYSVDCLRPDAIQGTPSTFGHAIATAGRREEGDPSPNGNDDSPILATVTSARLWTIVQERERYALNPA